MCLCNGSGGITTRESWGIHVMPCPDTNCTFDKEAENRKYKAWRKKVNEYFDVPESTTSTTVKASGL